MLAAAGELFVVGRGIGLAMAQEAALKLKEICGIHAEAMSAAELMHGPLTLAGPKFPVLVFSQQDEAFQSVADLVAVLAARDVPVIAAGAGARRRAACRCPSDPALNPFVTPIALHPELLSAGGSACPGARPRSRRAAASEEGDGDALMAFAIVGAQLVRRRRIAMAMPSSWSKRTHRGRRAG